jgi:tetratricopeptide (TPR) repeat protein
VDAAAKGPRPRHIGAYQVFEELGQGGMGVVFRAQAPSGEQVAIKLVLAARLLNQGALARFQREVRALGRLDHPGVVRMRDMGVYDGRPYLVMDLVRGPSLRRKLADEGPLPVPGALQVALALARTLEHLHQNQLLHRDVKPDNVLLVDGRPLLTDFGLVKLVDESQEKLSNTGQMLGTPGYWAPEQAQGELGKIGPASDVYGLGATLYACLTGRPPVQAESLLELFRTGFAVDPPSVHRPGLEPELDAICLRALAPDLSVRYRSAGELAEDLERLLAGPSSRSPRRGVAAAAALALGAALLGAGLLRNSDPAAARSPAPQPAPGASEEPTLEETPEETPPAPVMSARELSALSQVELEARLRNESLPAGERARLYVQRGARRAAAQDPEGAYSDYNRAVGLDPGYAEAYGARGTIRILYLGEIQAGTRDFERAFELEPDNPALYRNRAFVRTKGRRYHEALADLERALELDPGEAQTHLLRADIFNALDDFAHSGEAYRAFLEACEETASDPQLQRQRHTAWYGLGVALARTGDHTGAVVAYTRALELEPSDSKALYARALAHSKRQEHSAAIRDMTASLALETDVDVLLQRAYQRLRLQDLRGAEEDAEAALALAPRLAGAYQCRANIGLARGRVEAALEDLDVALGLEPSAEVYGSRARALAMLGRRKEALADFDRAMRGGADVYAEIWRAALSGEVAELRRRRGQRDWPAPLVAYVGGRIDLRQLLGAVEELGDAQVARMRRCEAYCFAGMVADEAGDRGRARHYYEASLATGVTRYFEYQWARHRLAAGGLVHHVNEAPLEGLFEEAQARAGRGDAAGALAATDTLEAAGEVTVELKLLQAQAHHDLERDLDALDALDEALELRPGLGEALRRRGHLRTYRGDYRQAVDDLTQALEALPEREAELRLARGRALEAALRLDEAEADARQAHAAGSASAAARLARLRLARGASAGEVLELLEGQTGPGASGEAVLLRAWACLLAGDPKAAREEISGRPGDDPLGRRAALWLLHCGDAAPALALSERPIWAGALAEMLTGPRTLEDLRSLARSATDPFDRAARACDAFCHAGVEAERQGQQALARERYQAAVDTGATTRLSYTWAARRLSDGVMPLGW